MAEVVRVASLTGFFPVMQSFGVNPDRLLREVGITRAMLSGDPELAIPARAAARLLERGAQATHCTTFGLLMAEKRTIGEMGTTSLLIAHQPTLRDALAAVFQYRNRINSTLALHIEEFGDSALLRSGFVFSRPEPSRQASDLVLAIIAQLCRSVLGPGWRPQLACFAHSPPPASEMPTVTRIFGCPTEFDSEFNALLVGRSDLDQPNRLANPALAGHARNLIEAASGTEGHTIAEDVAQMIVQLLPSGRASVQSCAAALGMTVRTLQRMLDTQSTSFSELLNQARLQLTGQYLANPRLRITDIAAMLGYSSTGAFTRWHVQTTGQSPRQWRSSAKQAGRYS
jgi:AraC-like DNA-binding protein